MFLTTNRVEAIDAAFESRIDLSFNYDTLTNASRRQIWANFIMRLPEEKRAISEADLDALAEVELNGRQIKSAIKTATMLAAKKKEPLAVVLFGCCMPNHKNIPNAHIIMLHTPYRPHLLVYLRGFQRVY